MPDANRTVGVLVSGGLDSCILAADLLRQGRTVRPFFVRSRLAWEEDERAALRRFLAAIRHDRLLELVELQMPLDDLYGEHWSVTGLAVPDAHSPDEAVYLPGRNALLFLKAAIWCQMHSVDELAMAPLGTSPFADASAEFRAAFEAAINLGAPRPVRLVCPFGGMTKQQVMELGRGWPLKLTWSCIAPRDGQHCGRCNKCAERQAAFREAGIVDETGYAAE